MKRILKRILHWGNWLWLRVRISGGQLIENVYCLASVSVSEGASVSIRKAELSRTRITVGGANSAVIVAEANLYRCVIKVLGVNSRVEIGADVKMCAATIIVRGDDCSVLIGKGSYFGGIRIVSEGMSNVIEIGENCLFSDNIEVWGSDTHEIVDDSGNVINRSRAICIGDHVWVGSHVKILKGALVGSGSVLGMGSIITGDVPDNCVACGVPSRVIRRGVEWRLGSGPLI